MGLNMLLDIVIPDYDALCPIQAKSCTCWQLSDADYLLSYTISSRSTTLMVQHQMAVAAQNKKQYDYQMKFVEQPIRPAPDLETADPDTIEKYYETVNLEQEVACLMLSSMSPDLQRTL
ncbi:hypothetical protein Tco_0949276 [Tanacetum coccineum]